MSEEGKVFRIRLDDRHLKEDITAMFENLKLSTESSKRSVRDEIEQLELEVEIKIKQMVAKAERLVNRALAFSSRSLRNITDVVQNYSILFGQTIQTQLATQIAGAISTISYLEAQMAAAALSPATWAAVPLYAAVIFGLLDVLAQTKIQSDLVKQELQNNLKEQFEVILERID